MKYVHVRVDRIWFERLHYILLIGRGHRETLGEIVKASER